MLPIHGHLGQVRDNFARQFTADGAFYLYRHGQRGAAYRLTAVEKEAFVADFNRGLGRIYWSAVVAVVVILLMVPWCADLVPRALRPWSATIGLGVTVIVFVAIWRRLWTGPVRALERRAPVALPLDGTARWRVNVGQLLWTPIVLGAAVCLLLVAISVQSWRIGGSGLDYAITGGIGVAFFGAIAVMKQRAR